MEAAGGVAPLGGAAHEGVEFALDRSVIESLAEEMPVVTHDHGLSEEHGGVVELRCASKARVDRHAAQHDLQIGQFGPVGEFVAVPRVESGEERDRSRGEKQEAGSGLQPDRSPREEFVPEQRGQREVAPDHELGVVPGPGREQEGEAEKQSAGRHAVEHAFGAVGTAAAEYDKAQQCGQRQEDAEVPQPEPRSAILLHPARVEAEGGSCGESRRDHAGQPCRGNDADQPDSKERPLEAARPGGCEAGGEQDAQEKEGRRVEKGHGGVEGNLSHERKTRSVSSGQLRAPHCHKHEDCRQGEKEPPLGHQHGEEEILPLGLALHDVRRPVLHQSPGAEAAGEEKSGEGETASPPPEGGRRGRGTKQSGPPQSLVNRQAGRAQDRIPEVHARVISESRPREERIVGPERAAIGPPDDEVEVQGGVAEVVRREDFEFVALFVDDPDKGTESGEGENGEEDGVGPGDFLPRGGCPLRRHGSGQGAQRKGDPCPARIKASAQGGQSGRADGGHRGENETAAEDPPTGHGSPLRARRPAGKARMASAKPVVRNTTQSSTPERNWKRTSS